MSGAGAALTEAAMAALRQVQGLSGVFEAAPVQAADCHAVVEAGLESDWSHKSGTGREVRVAATIRAEGERPDRLRRAATEAEAALAALGADISGWRIVTMQFLRSRMVRDGRSGWAAVIEFRARMLAL
jgi:hypothetical protein